MAFVLPTFNIQAEIWTWFNVPFTGAPRLTVDCQLRAPSMQNASASVSIPSFGPQMVILVPALTDLRDHYSTPGTHGDYLMVPAGSGRKYYCIFSDDVGKGFPNEHRFGVIVKLLGQEPVPFP